jgi:hypothetical protein
VWSLLLALLPACGSNGGHAVAAIPFGDGGSDAGDGPRMLSPTPTPTSDCPPEASVIYVTDTSNQLYAYDPVAGSFTQRGRLACAGEPDHMTVDRHGTAWISDTVGNLYTANPTTGECKRFGSWPYAASMSESFALVFLGLRPDDDATLYMIDDTDSALAKMDTLTGAITRVTDQLEDVWNDLPGEPPLPINGYVGGDLTSTGDGSLYYLLFDYFQGLLTIDPADGFLLGALETGIHPIPWAQAVPDAAPAPVMASYNEALAYYGGLFYDFVGKSVYTIDANTGAVVNIGVAPIYVDGAGTSTCVPASAAPPARLQ